MAHTTRDEGSVGSDFTGDGLDVIDVGNQYVNDYMKTAQNEGPSLNVTIASFSWNMDG